MAREAIKKWTEHQHLRTWRDTPGCRHGKLFISNPCRKRADDLLRLSRHQLKMAVAFLTWHAPVRERLRIMGLYNGRPSCRFCGMEIETAQHTICSCEALSRQRYNVLGKPLVEPKEISTASVRDLCLFIIVTGLLNLCYIKLGCTISLKAAVLPGHQRTGPSEEEKEETRSNGQTDTQTGKHQYF
jgi:hypothetical protein